MARPRSEEARESVLAATRVLLSRDGYPQMSIEGIAAEAGVSKQTIYRWWPSKAHILAEALAEGRYPIPLHGAPATGVLEDDLVSWLSLASAQLRTADNAALARALIAVTATNPELGTPLNAGLATPLLHALTERIDQARGSGQVRPGADSRAVAVLLLSALAYAALVGEPLSDAQARGIVGVVLDGIRD